MTNFGATELRVVNPYEVAFREARSAVGAARLLASAGEFPTVSEATADCRLVVGTTAATRRVPPLELQGLVSGARVIVRQLKTAPVALLFGSEKAGLSNDDMRRCHWLLRIPTQDEQPSMNLGQAVAVCLYELARTNSDPKPKAAATKKATASQKNLRATAQDLDRLTGLLYDVLDASGYVQPRVEMATEGKLRRMLRRLNLTEGDAQIWLGMLRQIEWKLAKMKRGSPDN